MHDFIRGARGAKNPARGRGHPLLRLFDISLMASDGSCEKRPEVFRRRLRLLRKNRALFKAPGGGKELHYLLPGDPPRGDLLTIKESNAALLRRRP